MVRGKKQRDIERKRADYGKQGRITYTPLDFAVMFPRASLLKVLPESVNMECPAPEATLPLLIATEEYGLFFIGEAVLCIFPEKVPVPVGSNLNQLSL